MIEKHSVTMTGASGTEYNLIFSALADQDESEGGVYVVSICGGDDSGGSFDYQHSPIFLGQTDNLAAEFIDHPKAKCFELAAQAMKVGTDAITVGSVIENDPGKRKEIEEDLSDCFKWICNSWTG